MRASFKQCCLLQALPNLCFHVAIFLKGGDILMGLLSDIPEHTVIVPERYTPGDQLAPKYQFQLRTLSWKLPSDPVYKLQKIMRLKLIIISHKEK